MNGQALHSAIYAGHVRHRRHAPTQHSFKQPLMMLYLDLDELERVFAGRWFWSVGHSNLAWFRRADYLDPETSDLRQALLNRIENETGDRPAGPVRMLSHLRTFGHCFNPVTFYYCFQNDGETLHSVLAQITNTPWGERHSYILPAAQAQQRHTWLDFHFRKDFHVSPFMPMELDYRWCFRAPDERMNVHMDVARDGEHLFDATLSLKRHPLNGRNLAWVLARYPAMSLQVSTMIRWQALRLWLKKTPLYPHPTSLSRRST